MVVMMIAITKVTLLAPEENWNKFGICMIISGKTDKTMILAMYLVSKSVVMPQPRHPPKDNILKH